jgi:hypothetical protein
MDKENTLRFGCGQAAREEQRDSRNSRDDQKELRTPPFPDVQYP